MSDGNNFVLFCAYKMSMETEKRTYLTVILPIVTVQKKYNTKLLTCFFVRSQTIYISHGANIH